MPMGLDRLESLEVEDRLDQPGAGRIAIEDGEQVDPDRLGDRGIVPQHFAKGLLEESSRNIVKSEPGCDPVQDGVFQLFVVEHIGVGERRQAGFGRQHRARLGSHARKDRLAGCELDDLSGYALHHYASPRRAETPAPRPI